ncbi:MAG TPA: DUF3106 domain-containing protein [Ideonella sp.]|nr:DUF3106 domain-containing protein [Ideonella sp.]
MKAPFLWSPSPSRPEHDLSPRAAVAERGRAFLQLAAASALAACLLEPLAARAQADPSWAGLTPQQRSVLAPLQADWHQLQPQNRAKWLEIAGRFPNMPPKQQQRMQQRMTEWSRMSPDQRVEARANYQSSKELPRRDRQAEWEAYRALPQDQRDALAARARPGSAWEPSDDSGNRLRRAVPADTKAAKPNSAGEPPRYRERSSLPPSVTRGNPGATTNLVNVPPSPPPHQQQSGLPRITATPGMVDRATLLPQRGPQGAGVRGNAASGPKNPGKQK